MTKIVYHLPSGQVGIEKQLAWVMENQKACADMVKSTAEPGVHVEIIETYPEVVYLPGLFGVEAPSVRCVVVAELTEAKDHE